MEGSMRYAAWLTDAEGVDHLYAMAKDIHEAYDIFQRNQELWFDPILEGDQEFPRYSVIIHYRSIEVAFGSTKPIQFVEKSSPVGTYGQLEAAFRIKYDNEDEWGVWEIIVNEIQTNP